VNVGCIPFLSYTHSYESLGPFPHRVGKLKNLIKDSKETSVLLLYGGKNISAFSSTKIDRLSFPLVDSTSSRLTHSYTGLKGEVTVGRIEKVRRELSFEILNLIRKKTIQMPGKENILQQEHIQSYN